jgi:hypothetical protein
LRRLYRLFVIAGALSQVQASCNYSPPPVLSQGQSADSLGSHHWAAGSELGYGTNASWWTATNLGHPEVRSGWVGVGRFRYGISDDVDMGLVAGQGPLHTTVIGPEVKWRFAQAAPENAEGSPGFHAAWISGMGVGSSRYPYEVSSGAPVPRHLYLAPYTGLLGSGGIELVKMFAGLRFAASETLGSPSHDFTLYPTFAFGVVLQAASWLRIHAEGDLAAGVTMHDTSDTGVLAYPAMGITIAPQ